MCDKSKSLKVIKRMKHICMYTQHIHTRGWMVCMMGNKRRMIILERDWNFWIYIILFSALNYWLIYYIYKKNWNQKHRKFGYDEMRFYFLEFSGKLHLNYGIQLRRPVFLDSTFWKRTKLEVIRVYSIQYFFYRYVRAFNLRSMIIKYPF